MSNKLSLMVNFVGVDKLSGSLRNIMQLGRKGSQSIGKLTGESRKLKSQLAGVRRELRGASGNVTGLIDRERALERQIEQTNRDLAERKRLMKIDADKRAMQRRGDAMMSSGRDQMVQGATLAAPLILATKSAAEFSSGMVDIQQKAELSNKATDKLGRNILVAARNARQLPEAMRSGLDLLLARGLDVDAANDVIGPAGRLATAYKVDIPDAAGAAYSSLQNLKVAARDVPMIFDAMAAAGNAGGFEVADMARHFPALTAQLQALDQKGVPAVADLSAALQVAMHTAGNADEAGNNIKNLLAKINAPVTVRAFKKNFGVDLPAAMAKLEAKGYSAMEAIAMVTKEATGGDMKKLGYAFEDMQARQGIMALMQNMDEYRAIRDAAMNSKGTVDAGFDQRAARDATVNWRAFMGSVSALAITIGTTLLPAATDAMNMITSLASSVGQWAQANPEAAGTIAKLVAGLAVFKIAMGAATFLVGGFLGPLAKFIAFSQKVGLAAKAFTVLRTASLFLASGMAKAGALLLANPIILVVTLIAAAIGVAAYLIYTHWDTIKAAFWSAVESVSGAMNTVWAFLKSAFAKWVSLHSQAIQIGKDIIGGLVAGIMAAPGRVWTALKGIVGGAIGNVKDMLGIASPSRVFMAIGDHTGEGFARGIAGKRSRVEGVAGRMARGAIAAGAVAMAPTAALAQPMAPSATAKAQARGMAGDGRKVEIHIHQLPGEDARELARRVAEELRREEKSAALSSYEDEI